MLIFKKTTIYLILEELPNISKHSSSVSYLQIVILFFFSTFKLNFKS